MRIKKFNEAVGVPDDLIRRSEILTQKVIDLVSESEPVESDTQYNNDIYTFVDDINFEIYGEDFNTFKLILNVQKGVLRRGIEIDDVVIAGFAMSSNSKFDRETARLQKIHEGEITMSISFATKGKYEIKDLVECLSKYDELMPIVAHELKHAYDSVYKPHESVYGRARYHSITTLQRVTPLKSIINFAYGCYYTIIEENLVRSTEMAGRMKEKGITKKNFSEWFHQTEVVKKLSEIRDLTFDKFTQDLYDDIDAVKNFLNDFYDLSDLNNSEIVYVLLEFVANNFYEIMEGSIGSVIQSGIDLSELIEGRNPKKINLLMKKFASEVKKYSEDPLRFFEDKIKENSKTAEKMIKKLSGLYSLAPDDDTTNEKIRTFSEYRINEELNPKDFLLKLVNVFRNINDKIQGRDLGSKYKKLSNLSILIYEGVLDSIIPKIQNGTIEIQDAYTHLINDLVVLVNELDDNLTSSTFGVDLKLDRTMKVLHLGDTFEFPTAKLLKFLVLGNKVLGFPGMIGLLDPDSVLTKNYVGNVNTNFNCNKTKFFINLDKKGESNGKEVAVDFLNQSDHELSWAMEDEIKKISFQDLENELMK